MKLYPGCEDPWGKRDIMTSRIMFMIKGCSKNKNVIKTKREKFLFYGERVNIGYV